MHFSVSVFETELGVGDFTQPAHTHTIRASYVNKPQRHDEKH